MNINSNALRHPRTQATIERAMRNAVKFGAAIACSAAGKELVSIIHDRKAIPAFSFYRGTEDVTADMLRVLRGQA